MIVRCINNDVTKIADAALRKRLRETIHIDGAMDILTVGIEYSVQAVEEWAEGLHLYLETVRTNYPYPFPVELFDIVDGRIPNGWWANLDIINGQIRVKRITFQEWAYDNFFYERLVDDDHAIQQIYLKNRQL